MKFCHEAQNVISKPCAKVHKEQVPYPDTSSYERLTKDPAYNGCVSQGTTPYCRHLVVPRKNSHIPTLHYSRAHGNLLQ